LWATNAQTHYIQFGDAASGGNYYRGAIGYAHASDTLLLLQSGTTALSFTGSQAATFSGNIIANKLTTSTGLEYQVRNTNGSSGNHVFKSFNTTILTLDGATNASTFAGTITSGALTVGSSGTSRFTDTNAFPLQINRGLDVDSVGANGAVLGIGTIKSGTYKDGVRISGGLETNGTDGNFTLQTLGGGAYTTALTISSSQNATFAGMITVNGGGIDIDNDNDIRLRFDNASTFYAGLEVATTAGDMIATTAVNDFAIRSTENMLFATGGNVERMRITAQGNVKIGSSTTGTPATQADDLVIDKGASESGISLISTAAASIRFGDAANTSIGAIEYNHNSNYMRFNTNNAERMRIDSSGAATFTGAINVGSRQALEDKTFGYSSTYKTLILGSAGTTAGTDAVTLCFGVDISGNPSGSFTGNGRELVFRNEGAFITPNSANNGFNNLMSWDTNGNVGIGTTSPNQKLTIGFADSGTDGISFRSATYASLAKILCQNDSSSTNGNLQFYTRSGGDVLERMRITSAGQINMGTSTAYHQFEPEADLDFNLVMNAGQAAGNPNFTIKSSTSGAAITSRLLLIGSTGNMTITGSLTQNGSISDISLKENIKPVENALDKIEKLNAVTFDWKKSDSILQLKEDYGFIAQEVEKVIPEIVRTNDDDKKAINYNGITSVLVKAIQELSAKVEKLEQECKCK